MKVRVYGYRKCDTCRKAYKFLAGRDVTLEEIDITEKAPTKFELKNMLAALDGKVKALFNTSGLAYREGKIGARLKGMTASEAIALLAGNGRLVKRPFLVIDGEPVAVGFDQARWTILLAATR